MPKTYQQQIGEEYEYFTMESIKSEYEYVYHHSDVPEKILYETNLKTNKHCIEDFHNDIGIDIVACKKGEIYFIQCKNFNDSIHIEDLSGFYFIIATYGLKGVVYYNGKLSKNIIKYKNNTIEHINLPYENKNCVNNDPPKEIIPRDYQIEAYDKLKNSKESIFVITMWYG